jgi:ParB-like chromosome segregation protein Spo0J
MTAAIAERPKATTTPNTPLLSVSPDAQPPLDANSASVNIPVNMIVRSPFNRIAQVSDEFVDNIRQNGVLQPIIVRPITMTLARLQELGPNIGGRDVKGNWYELVAGERRWLASKKANRASISAIIRELTDLQAMKIQIAENDQREDYSVLDRSEAYARLRNVYMQEHKGEKGWTEERCMDLIAVDCKNDKIKGRTVQQIIALGKLTMDCQSALRKGEIEASHGYELCRRSPEDQAELLLWLRQQTHHSQGDIPSVRRLKLEIRRMDELREAEKRSQPLFTPPQPGTSTTRVPTIAEVAAQTSAPAKGHGIDNRQPAPAHTAPRQKIAEMEKKRIEDNRAREEKQTRSVEIERQSRVLALDAIAKKVKLDRALLDLVAVDMLKNCDDEVSQFAVRLYNFPKPKAKSFSYNEIEKIGLAQVPKLKGGQLAGLLMAGLLAEEMFVYSGGRNECKRLEAMARRYKVDLGKIRKDLAAAAKLKAKGQKPKAGVRA